MVVLRHRGDSDAEAWVADQATKILKGKPPTSPPGSTDGQPVWLLDTRRPNAKAADQAADYLTHEKPYLDYHTALANGQPIATRVIEAPAATS